MSNQIYFRVGKPSRFKQPKEDSKPMNPILYFIIRSLIILAFLYFFLDDILRFVFGLF